MGVKSFIIYAEDNEEKRIVFEITDSELASTDDDLIDFEFELGQLTFEMLKELTKTGDPDSSLV